MFTYSSHYTIKRNKSSQVHKENKLYLESEILVRKVDFKRWKYNAR